MKWHNVKESPPDEGAPVIILRDGKPDLAYFCDGGFYRLGYDKILGILRKEYITFPVTDWADIKEAL